MPLFNLLIFSPTSSLTNACLPQCTLPLKSLIYFNLIWVLGNTCFNFEDFFHFYSWITWISLLPFDVILYKVSLVAQMLKNLLAMQEAQVWSLGQEDPLEKGMATHSSILTWRIPWTEKPGGLQSMVSQRVRHDWATNIFTFTYVYEK